MNHIALLGLGEVGKTLAKDFLERAIRVSGWDPEPVDIPAGVHFASSNPAAVLGADLILSANRSTVAVDVAREVAPTLRAGQVYADVNTAAPEVKRSIDRIFLDSPAVFADVAIMAPILPRGIRTPMLAGGEGAAAFYDLLAPFGTPITVLDAPAGEAATRKLLRSIVYKGVAAVLLEAVEAAEKLDLGEYAYEQIATMLPDREMVERFISGSKKHAGRRIDEMQAVVDFLNELEISPYTSDAARRRLVELISQTS